MREIKFRCWDKKNGGMIYYNKDTHDDLIFNFNSGDFLLWSEGNTWEIKDFILMQYTGLKDSKGVEMYEGDIVKYFNEMDVVCFAAGHFMVCDSQNPYKGNHEDLWKALERSPVTIIGNIYENPKLLKVRL